MFLLFFSTFGIICENKMGSKIKKHVGVSTRACVRPIGGGYNPNPKFRGVKVVPAKAFDRRVTHCNAVMHGLWTFSY